MRVFSTVTLLSLLWLFSSCIRDPNCDVLPKEDNVELIPIWGMTVNKPSRVFVQSYPQWGAMAIQNFISSSGGEVYLQKGRYDILLYSNMSSRIKFRNMESFGSAEAYVDADTQPDELYCGSVTGIEVEENKKGQRVEVLMRDMVRRYKFTYSGVTGLKYVNRVQVTIDGINQAVKMASGTLLPVTYMVNCNYTLTNDGFYGTLTCFGHGDSSTHHTFTVRFDYEGQTITKTYDVTEMLNEKGQIDIYDAIVFEPLDQGDLNTDVGDWEDNVVDIPIK